MTKIEEADKLRIEESGANAALENINIDPIFQMRLGWIAGATAEHLHIKAHYEGELLKKDEWSRKQNAFIDKLGQESEALKATLQGKQARVEALEEALRIWEAADLRRGGQTSILTLEEMAKLELLLSKETKE